MKTLSIYLSTYIDNVVATVIVTAEGHPEYDCTATDCRYDGRNQNS